MKKKKKAASSAKSNSTGCYEGVVYRYVLKKKDDPDYEKCYVGETDNENDRRSKWRRQSNFSYAGRKLVRARKRTDVNKDWVYEVLERVYAQTKKELKKRLKERETHYIAKFDSFYHGFNSNKGGSGLSGVKGKDYPNNWRRKVGAASKGRKMPREAVERMAAKHRGIPRSQEVKDKISAGNKGKKRTTAQNLAQSKRMKQMLGGKDPTAATKAAKEWVKKNGGGYWKNHTIPTETKAKMKQRQQENGTKIKATEKNGTIRCFSTMLDAKTYYGINNVGSVAYAVNTGKPNKQSGVKFEQISKTDYEQWRQQYL